MKSLTAPVAEIFCSIQGEGLYMGQRQIFLRFAGCNLACRYCDEPAALDKATAALMTVAEAAAAVTKLARARKVKNISLTGGEPLLRWNFIKALAPGLKKAGLVLHLETNGTLCRELSKVADLMDVIAMDIKLPSATGGKDCWTAHEKFLSCAPEKTFIKTVLTSKTKMSDLCKAVDLAASVWDGIPFFLQPATAGGKGIKPPAAGFIAEACCCAAARLSRVKVLRQQHPIWGVK